MSTDYKSYKNKIELPKLKKLINDKKNYKTTNDPFSEKRR